MWETWIYHTCSKGSLFYAQLIGAPEKSRAYGSINCEVRLHIHDGRIALVDCYPQRLIGFWFLNDIIRIGFNDSKMQFFANDKSGLDDGMYSLICGRIQLLEKHYKLASKPGLLTLLLKQKEGDGLWYEDKSNDSSQAVIQQFNVRNTQNPEINHFGVSNVHRSSSHKSKASVSQTGVPASSSYMNVPFDPRFLPISNASSMASCCVSYANDMGVHSQSDPSVSSIGEWDKKWEVLVRRDRHVLLKSTISRADSWPRPLTDEIIGRREMFTRTRKWSAVNGRETKGRFVKQEKKGGKHYECGSFRGRSGRLPKRSRSLGMESRCLSASREENWNRAKRIIGGVRKSINDLNVCKVSTSLDKLASPAISQHETTAVAPSSADDTNQVNERTAADFSQEPESMTQGFASSLSTQSINRLPGLIKLPPKKFGLKRARHILTKSLQKSISGSFSKYDGERSANHFNLEDAKCTGPVVDCIESAVKKGRARLIEAERRNSGFTETAVPTNPPNHSVRTVLPENVAVQSICSNSVNVVESAQSYCDRGSSRNSVTSSDDECYNAANAVSANVNRHSPQKSESLSTASVRTQLLMPPSEGPSRAGSLRGSAVVVKEANAEIPQSPPFCAALPSLSGSYCNLETGSRNLSRKSFEVSRTVYVRIDPVATLGATQTQRTMMRDRARVGNLVKNKRFSSQNNVENRDRGEEGYGLNRGGFFARHLWRKLPASMSHSDLRF